MKAPKRSGIQMFSKVRLLSDWRAEIDNSIFISARAQVWNNNHTSSARLLSALCIFGSLHTGYIQTVFNRSNVQGEIEIKIDSWLRLNR